ncbi:MAG: methionyl-tRNA formyltransferase [Betaproteobacteria bacterium]
MRIVYAGTPAFAVPALAALIAAGHEIALVLSQPDRPAGRGLKLTPSPVKALAAAHGLAIDTPETLSLRKGGEAAARAHERLAALVPDLLVVAAYGLILPQAVLDIPGGIGPGVRAINLHASLLPRWRGAAPSARAIEAGDTETGVDLMEMEAGLDTGPVLAEVRTAIGAADTAGTLTERLAQLGAELLVRALDAPESLVRQPQPEEGMCYAHKIDKAEARVDWTRPAVELERRLRAFDPMPAAHTLLRGEVLKLWQGTVEPATTGEPGTVLAVDGTGVLVATGRGGLRLTRLQRAGGKRLAAREFLAGCPIEPGEHLG